MDARFALWRFQSLVRVVLNEHYDAVCKRLSGGKFQSLVRVVLNEHLTMFQLWVRLFVFQSLVRVVLNEHRTFQKCLQLHNVVSIPRSGCAE